MKIGLDYGGVISFAPDGWEQSILKAKERGHQFYLVSHVQPGGESQIKMRDDFTEKTGVTNLTFSDLDWYTQREQVAKRKSELCQQYEIEIFIDDDLYICQEVGRICDRCAALYIPQNLWQIGQRLIDGLGNDW